MLQPYEKKKKAQNIGSWGWLVQSVEKSKNILALLLDICPTAVEQL